MRVRFRLAALARVWGIVTELMGQASLAAMVTAAGGPGPLIRRVYKRPGMFAVSQNTATITGGWVVVKENQYRSALSQARCGESGGRIFFDLSAYRFQRRDQSTNGIGAFEVLIIFAKFSKLSRRPRGKAD